jgi:hypothetical protein
MNRELFASKSTIRAAIFDVIDAGDSEDDPWKEGAAWLLLKSESEVESERRYRFADAVIGMIEDLQELPFKFTKLENLCPTHMREALPRPSAAVCTECEKKQKVVGA